MIKKLLSGISLSIVLAGISTSLSLAQCKIADASAPTVDATIETIWSVATVNNITKPLDGTSTPAGFSGKWRSIYTSSTIYFLFEVTKNGSLYKNQTDNSLWWKDDAVEVYLDADHSAGTSYDGVNDFQFGFRYTDGTVRAGINNPSNSTTGITFNLYTTTGGYNVEIAIPWTTLKVTPTAGNKIGIEATVDVSSGTDRITQMITYNSTGHAYENPSLFNPATLGSCYSVATLTTTAASGITTTAAASGGNISADGGASVTARGVCWSTSHNPTTADSKTTDGTGTGSFTSALSGLTANTTYYVRAYATNSEGTAYGTEQTFTTSVATAVINGTTDDGISLYPNPSSGLYNLDIDQLKSAFVEINITNAEGKPVYNKRENNAGSSFHESFDFRTQKGVYYIEVITDNGILRDKVVVY